MVDCRTRGYMKNLLQHSCLQYGSRFVAERDIRRVLHTGGASWRFVRSATGLMLLVGSAAHSLQWTAEASLPPGASGRPPGWRVERFERQVAVGERLERTLEFRCYRLELPPARWCAPLAARLAACCSSGHLDERNRDHVEDGPKPLKATKNEEKPHGWQRRPVPRRFHLISPGHCAPCRVVRGFFCLASPPLGKALVPWLLGSVRDHVQKVSADSEPLEGGMAAYRNDACHPMVRGDVLGSSPAQTNT
jgi:hypothetical protein